jgi:C1A family cysteine protease/uncharacterized protein YccT (UPF0319 family)
MSTAFARTGTLTAGLFIIAFCAGRVLAQTAQSVITTVPVINGAAQLDPHSLLRSAQPQVSGSVRQSPLPAADNALPQPSKRAIIHAGGQIKHGLKNGLRKLTDKETAFVNAGTIKITHVLPNAKALARSAALPGAASTSLPSSVKNIEYLPVIGDQGDQGSCAAFSSCYYYKSYQQAQVGGWTRADPDVNPERIASPAFCYHLANGGGDYGSDPGLIMQLVASIGEANWKDMPYDDTDAITWPAQNVWKDAASWRAQSAGTIDLTTSAGITNLKQHLANGDIAVIAMSVTDSLYTTYPCPGSCPGVNNNVIYGQTANVYGGHAITVIGYNDNMTYTDSSGTVHSGAFELVNSWGADWGVADLTAGTSGFFWLSYDFMQNDTWGTAWTMVARSTYTPTVYGVFGLNHPERGNLNVGFSGTSASGSQWSFTALPNLGGDVAVNQTIVADLSDYNPDLTKNILLNVYDYSSSADTGNITFLGVQQAGGALRSSPNVPKATIADGSVTVTLPPNSSAVTYLAPAVATTGYTSLSFNWTAVPGASYVAVLAADSAYTTIVSSGATAAASAQYSSLLAGKQYYFEVKLSTEADAAFPLNRITTATDAWLAAASMANPRGYLTTTTLQNGLVLAAGGYKPGVASQKTAELYSPFTGTWSPTGSMNTERSFSVATLLQNGKVLLAGGDSNSGITATAEIYDPSSGTWSSAGSMSVQRFYHAATLMANGKVLVTGGINNNSALLSSADIYDPATGKWSAAAPLPTARCMHMSVLLQNGKVLVAGGWVPYGSNQMTVTYDTEIYDPATNTWTAGASLAGYATGPEATFLKSGKLLMAGSGYKNVQIYDPSANSWSFGCALSDSRVYPAMYTLPDGTVLIAAGGYSSSDIYNQNTGTCTPTSQLALAREMHGSAQLPDGSVMVTGGYAPQGYTASAEIYRPAGITSSTALSPKLAASGQRALSASWNAVPGASYAAVLASDSGYTNIVSSATASTGTASYGGLSAGTGYYFEVKLSTETDFAYTLNRVSAVTAAPATALSPSVSSASASSLSFAWTAAGGAATAVLAKDAAYSNIVSSAALSSGSTSYNGLSAGTGYYFEVKLSTETDAAYLPNRISGRTAGATALSPRATFVSSSSVTLAWNAATAAATAVLAKDAAFSIIVSSGGATGGGINFPWLTAATGYYFEVKLSTETDASYALNRIPLLTVPAAPTSLSGTPQSSSAILWSWTAVAGASGYYVVSSSGAAMVALSSGTLSWLESGLNPGSRYGIGIEAYNASGAGGSVSASTCTLPAAPYSVAGSALSRTSIAVQIGSYDPSGTTYIVEYSSNTSAGWQSVSSTSTSCQLNGLAKGGSYALQVAAINANGAQSAFTQGNSVTLPGNPVVASIAGVTSGTGIQLSVVGSSFMTGDGARLEKSGQSDRIAASSATVSYGGMALSVFVDLSGLATGYWNVVVFGTDGSASASSSNAVVPVSPLVIGSGITQIVTDNNVPSTTVSIPDSGDTVTISSGSVANGFVAVSTAPSTAPIVASASVIASATGALAQGYEVVSMREYAAYSNWNSVSTLAQPITVTINYPAGTVDSAGLAARQFRLVALNSSTGKWEPVSSSAYSVNTTANTVTATTADMTVYGLQMLSALSTLDQVKVYPIPWLRGSGGKFDSAAVPGCGSGLIFDNLTAQATVKIFGIQGQLVRTLSEASSSGCIAWDGKNDAGRNVASGIYLAEIKSSSGMKIIKLALER